jgi:hypothetical protein
LNRYTEGHSPRHFASAAPQLALQSMQVMNASPVHFDSQSRRVSRHFEAQVDSGDGNFAMHVSQLAVAKHCTASPPFLVALHAAGQYFTVGSNPSGGGPALLLQSVKLGSAPNATWQRSRIDRQFASLQRESLQAARSSTAAASSRSIVRRKTAKLSALSQRGIPPRPAVPGATL